MILQPQLKNQFRLLLLGSDKKGVIPESRKDLFARQILACEVSFSGKFGFTIEQPVDRSIAKEMIQMIKEFMGYSAYYFRLEMLDGHDNVTVAYEINTAGSEKKHKTKLHYAHSEVVRHSLKFKNVAITIPPSPEDKISSYDRSMKGI